MCEFISWVELDDEVLYLDDEDVFSKFGKEIFKDCKDNDILGHGAIRKYYNIPDNKGIGREVKDFWNVKKLPEILQSKVEKFPGDWKEIFTKYFQNDDLCYLVAYAPDNTSRHFENIL